MAAINAKVPFILITDGYTGKTPKEIKHNKLISDFVEVWINVLFIKVIIIKNKKTQKLKLTSF